MTTGALNNGPNRIFNNPPQTLFFYDDLKTHLHHNFFIVYNIICLITILRDICLCTGIGGGLLPPPSPVLACGGSGGGPRLWPGSKQGAKK
jgi:hypothetical protein